MQKKCPKSDIDLLSKEIEEQREEIKRLKEKVVQLKTQLLPNELEQNMIEAMDEEQALKGE